MIILTGPTGTGKSVLAGTVETVKRVTLELGGNDAGIILPGTKIDPLLEKLFWGCFINGGQTCAALKRLYVHESQYEEVASKFADYVAKIPVGRLGQANEIARGVAFLCSEEGGFVTGSTLSINGGQQMY